MTDPIPRPEPLTSTTLLANIAISGLQVAVTAADIKYAQGSFDLDARAHLALADAPVLEVDGDLLDAVAQALRDVAQLDLEDIAIGADALQADMLQRLCLPALEPG